MRLPRWLHRAYAWALSYFWIPCPLCGRHFGGHEWLDGTYEHPATIRKPNSSGSTAICPDCTRAGRGEHPVERRIGVDLADQLSDAGVEGWQLRSDAYHWGGEDDAHVDRGGWTGALTCDQLDAVVEAGIEPPQPLTEEAMQDTLRGIRESQPRVVCSPEVAAGIRDRGLPAVIVESEHVPPGTAYVFRPDLFDSQREEDR